MKIKTYMDFCENINKLAFSAFMKHKFNLNAPRVFFDTYDENSFGFNLEGHWLAVLPKSLCLVDGSEVMTDEKYQFNFENFAPRDEEHFECHRTNRIEIVKDGRANVELVLFDPEDSTADDKWINKKYADVFELANRVVGGAKWHNGVYFYLDDRLLGLVLPYKHLKKENEK